MQNVNLKFIKNKVAKFGDFYIVKNNINKNKNHQIVGDFCVL